MREVLVQLPPRGCWKPSGSTAVSYDFAARWLGAPLAEPDIPAIIRRHLAAYGPASAADAAAWCGITRLGPIVKAMDDPRAARGRGRSPTVGPGRRADDDIPAPVRLLGTYDNLWLSHAGRDRVTTPERRSAWMGTNGGGACTIFVDGWLEGLWRVDDGRVEVELLRSLTSAERSELDEEITQVEALLAR